MLPTPTADGQPAPLNGWRLRNLRRLLGLLRCWGADRHFSFSTLLALGLSGMVALAVGSVLLVAVMDGRAATLALSAERASRTLQRVSEAVDQIVDPVRQQMAYLTAAVAEGRIDLRDRDQLNGMLVSSLSARPQLAGIGFLAPDGWATRVSRSEIRTRREKIARPAEVSRWLEQVAKTRAPLWQPPSWSTILQQAVITLRIPVFDADDRLVGALEAVISVADLSAQLGQMLGDSSQTPYILYDNGYVLSHPQMNRARVALGPDHALVRLDELNDPVLLGLMNLAGHGDYDDGRSREERGLAKPMFAAIVPQGAQGWEYEYNDVEYRTLFRTLYNFGEKPWIIGVYYAGSLISDQLHRIAMAGAAGLGVLVLSVTAAFWLGRRIAQPVTRFAAASQVVRTGNLDQVPRVSGSLVREFDTAARAFNEMVAGLKERERIRDLFGRYVAPEVAERLIREPQRLTLGGERREVSLLFTDITGFTGLSETHAPEVVVPLLNRYLEEVCRIIAAHGGIVVDFIGDAVFALFGAPEPLENHARSAILAAEAIEAFGRNFAAGAQHRGLPFGITRIGVHSGVAVVGNFGSEERMKYGAAGDVVNVAARLEKINKLFGTCIACSADAIRLAGMEEQARPLGLVHLRGRQSVMEVWEPLTVQDRWTEEWRNAFRAMRCGDPETADRIHRLAGQRQGDVPAKLLAEQIGRGFCPPVIDADDGIARQL